MTDGKVTKPMPITKLRDALFNLQMLHDDVTAAESGLAKARHKLNSARLDMTAIYSAAAKVAEGLEEVFPDTFMSGQILVKFDDDHRATVTHIPHTEGYELLSLADRAGEREDSGQ